jgi:chromosome segregation ATPase
MARAGVNYSNINQAAEYIQSEGNVPTVDRVREYLGTGSKSTIAPLLKQWRETNATSSNEHALPKDVINSVKSLYELVQQQAQIKVEEIRKECNDVTDSLQQHLSDSLTIKTQLDGENSALKTALEKSQTENSALLEALKTSRNENDKSAFRLEEIHSRVSELKAANSELKQECKDIRDHFEHYQQRSADERQHERDQFQAIQFRDQALIDNLTNQLNGSRSQLALETRIREKLDEKVAQISEEKQALVEQITKKNNECTALQSQFDLLTNEKHELLEQINVLKPQVASFTKAKIDADRTIDLLTQSHNVKLAELKESKEKLFNVSSEYQIALQEKAMLQGQLKQLLPPSPNARE